MNALFDQIPGYREAVNRESAVRDQSFLDLAEEICGLEVLPMTARHFLILDGIGSPFLLNAADPVTGVAPADVALFLWALSPDYSPSARWRRWRFIRSCRKLPFVRACCQIRRYVEDTFQDAPASGDANGPSFYASVATLVDCFAREYGWAERDILTMPLKRAFQYLRCIVKHRDPKATLFNPSDRVRGDWLARVNRKT